MNLFTFIISSLCPTVAMAWGFNTVIYDCIHLESQSHLRIHFEHGKNSVWPVEIIFNNESLELPYKARFPKWGQVFTAPSYELVLYYNEHRDLTAYLEGPCELIEMPCQRDWWSSFSLP